MQRLIQRRRVLQAGLTMCASALLPSARACEYFTSTMRVFHPWTRASGPADFAPVCMTFDEVVETDRLIGVETPVAAGAELSGAGLGPEMDLLIPAGEVTVLSETGTHIRLIGLRHELHVGREYRLTLHFERGGVVLAKLSVDFARFA